MCEVIVNILEDGSEQEELGDGVGLRKLWIKYRSIAR